MKLVDASLVRYVEEQIMPCYDRFDAAHRRDHIDEVIRRSLQLAAYYDVNTAMVYAIAAYHDTGLCEGRELHHKVSGHIIRNDANLRQWFDREQIETMAQAAEDHRASSKEVPRSIYGKIVAEADRLIDPMAVIRRTLQYGLSNYPEYDKKNHYRRFTQHLMEKYSDTGYLHLWLPESENAARLEELRCIIRDEKRLLDTFDLEFERLLNNNAINANE